MTAALCLKCGSIKFGAFLPCFGEDGCHAAPTGDQSLDCFFTDHYIAESSLRSLGAVIKQIRTAATTEEETVWSFLYFFAGSFPELFSITVPDPLWDRVVTALSGLTGSIDEIEMIRGPRLAAHPVMITPDSDRSAGRAQG